ncbi:7136_t:CDS:1 [Acaulospora colombiana]|uniref:7136_t:CDS:1 n=1 Tax=Acaulospora colombiana TaxID=27376 RepID=A0ACA9K3I7_9GLOM|nr:7136_t:CDS:1 [Acaulospora colombiana]
MIKILAALVVFIFVVARLKKRKTPISVLVTDPYEAKQILRNSDITSRAIPNQRLRKSFDISNPFTNSNDEYRQKFRNVIINSIGLKEDGWKRLAKLALETVNYQKYKEKDTVELVPWIQNIALNVILRGYMGFDANIHGIVDDIPKLINDIWIKSKEFNSNRQSISKSKCLLMNLLHKASLQQSEEKGIGHAPNVLQEISKIAQKHLDNVRSFTQPSPRIDEPTADELKSPLNILLPAYETMWRVLLYAVLEIKVRGLLKSRNDERKVKNNFLKRLDTEAKDLLRNPHRASKNNSLNLIVKETLRLYPATRHIHREKDGWKYIIDVEAIHRNPTAWGSDASRFNPERFKDFSQNDHYIPFSVGPMQCVATKFAPTLAAILIASVISSVDILDIVGNNTVSKYQANPDIPFENSRRSFENTFVRIVTRSS